MAFAESRSKHQSPLEQPSPDGPTSVVSTISVPPSPPLTSSSLSPASVPLSPSLLPRSRAPRRAPTTRPTSISDLPPSVSTAFRCLEDVYCGRYTGPSWVEYSPVCPDDLDALTHAAEVAGFKLRYDYDPSSYLLTLRMPEGPPHIFTNNGFARSISRCLEERLKLAIQEEQDRARARALRSIHVSPQVETEISFGLGIGTEKGTERSPDVAFYYQGYRYPPCLVEVGHSQKGASLSHLVRDYIGKTDGKIQTVITADIAHLNRTQRATARRRTRQDSQGRDTRSRSRVQHAASKSTAHISLYRLGERIIWNEVFRDDQGRPADGGIELSVADFVPLDLSETSPLPSRADLEALTFTVPFSELCDALALGEEQQKLEEQTPEPAQVPIVAGQKRVHFSWSEPEESDEDAGEGDDHDDDGSRERGRSARLSKRQRLDDRAYSRGRVARAGRASGAGVEEVARASAPGPGLPPRERRSSTRISSRQDQE